MTELDDDDDDDDDDDNDDGLKRRISFDVNDEWISFPYSEKRNESNERDRQPTLSTMTVIRRSHYVARALLRFYGE